jgi:hypothetical protein
MHPLSLDILRAGKGRLVFVEEGLGNYGLGVPIGARRLS